MKLEILTPEQEALMFQTRDEWVNHFFETKEIDKKAFEEGIKWLYKDLLKKKHPKVVYCGSWLECLKIINPYNQKILVTGSVENSVEASVKTPVWNSVRDSVKVPVWDSVLVSVRNPVWDSVWDSVWVSVENLVGDLVRAYSGCLSTYSNYGWTSFYDYFEKIGVLNNNEFKKYKKLIRSGVFQCYEYEDVVFAIQPPKIILRNEQGQMNSIEQKAFEWCNGDGFYYVNGFELKEEMFFKLKNKEFSLEEFLNESNEEVKSAIISFIQQRDGDTGIYDFFSKYLKEVDTFVDKKEEKYLEGTTKGMNVGVYTLFKGVVNNTDIAYVRCYCPSTDRMFFLGVDPKNTTVKDAIASLYQIPRVCVNDIVSISRQGEKFSTVLTAEMNKKLKNCYFKDEELKDYVSLSGDEYFKLMKYEY